jgi:hypothetical protein
MNDLAAETHAFHFAKALEALQDMTAIAFDMSTQGTQLFKEAQDRFELHRSKCQKEFMELNTDATGT